MDELKPCPFCGSEDVWYFEERLHIMGNAYLMGVKCRNCGGAWISSDKRKCTNDAVRAWNRRVDNE